MGFDVEPRFFFSYFGVGISVGYHVTQHAESSIENTYFDDNVDYNMQLKCIPLLGTFYYRLDMSDSVIMLLGIGGGYYKGTMEFEWEDDFSLSSTYGEGETIKFKGNAYGAHARLEWNYIFSDVFTLYGGIEGRYVKFSEFKDVNNTLKNIDGGNLSAQLTGVFFYFGASVLM